MPEVQGRARVHLNERKLSVLFFSLFSAWMLAFVFEGQILFALTGAFGVDPAVMVFGGIAALMAGAFTCGFWIRTRRAAKRLFLISFLVFIAISVLFFFPPSQVWKIGLIAGSFFAGNCVAAWGFFLKSVAPKNERIKTIADMLILSNMLMIVLNLIALRLSPRLGLGIAMGFLLAAFLLALRLPGGREAASPSPVQTKGRVAGIWAMLAFLCLFIVVITINSGLMYQVVTPGFAHIEWLTSWYWAIPYVAALLVMRNLPKKTNRAYLLYVAIAMIGFSFIAFTVLPRTAGGYVAVDTLMMAAFGIYDLFWWSILGEMLDFYKNPAKVMGIGLSANVLGVLLGGILGSAMALDESPALQPTLLALAVVCVTLALLPPLSKRLAILLKGHAYLETATRAHPGGDATMEKLDGLAELSERERQVAAMLIEKKTYGEIAETLFISQNTVKYYVKNIYSKLNVKNRSEMISRILANEPASYVE